MAKLSRQYYIDAINLARNAGDIASAGQLSFRLRVQFGLAANEVIVGGVPCTMKLRTSGGAAMIDVSPIGDLSKCFGVDDLHQRAEWATGLGFWLDDAERLRAFDRARAWLGAQVPAAPKTYPLAANQVLCDVVCTLRWHEGEAQCHTSADENWREWAFGLTTCRAGDDWFRASAPIDRFVTDAGRVLSFVMRDDGEAEALDGARQVAQTSPLRWGATGLGMALYRFRDAERAKWGITPFSDCIHVDGPRLRTTYAGDWFYYALGEGGVPPYVRAQAEDAWRAKAKAVPNRNGLHIFEKVVRDLKEEQQLLDSLWVTVEGEPEWEVRLKAKGEAPEEKEDAALFRRRDQVGYWHFSPKTRWEKQHKRPTRRGVAIFEVIPRAVVEACRALLQGPMPCPHKYELVYPTKPKHGLLECTCAAESVLRIEGDLSKVHVTVTPKAARK